MTVRRRTTCIIAGHGTRCEAAREKDGRYCRTTDERLALRFELQLQDQKRPL